MKKWDFSRGQKQYIFKVEKWQKSRRYEKLLSTSSMSVRCLAEYDEWIVLQDNKNGSMWSATTDSIAKNGKRPKTVERWN